MTHRDIFKDDKITGSGKKHYLIVFAIMMAVWLMASGKFDLRHITMGAVTCLAAAWMAMPIMYVQGRNSDRYYFVFGVNMIEYLWYWIWLINEVRAASLDVATSVMRPEMDIEPAFFGFKAFYDNPMAHATLANSITLTPGTVTLHVSEDGVYSIHALTRGAHEGLLDGSMQKRIGEVFGEPVEIEIIPQTEALKGVQ